MDEKESRFLTNFIKKYIIKWIYFIMYIVMSAKAEILSNNNEMQNLLEDTRNELNILWKKTRDYEKFQILSKNLELKKGLTKLYDVSCERVFWEEWKKFESMNISSEINDVLKKYPDLWLKIMWDLNLPLWESKFSSLTTQQKYNYSILYDAIYWKNILYKKSPSSADIYSRIKNLDAKYVDKINGNFKLKNASNLLQLEKTLKEDFKLTPSESWKVKEYLEMIKKHPEFVNDYRFLEAWIWSWWWMLIWLVTWLLLWAIWMHYIDNIWKINPETTKTVWETVIEEPEAILYLLTQKFPFSTSGSIKKKMFTETENPNWIIEMWKNLLKRGINLFETKELNMEMVWDLALKYDLDGSSLSVSHSTWEVVLKVKKPDVILIDSNANVTYSNGEVVELDAFRNAEMELENDLKKKVIKEAKNNPRFYDVARQQTEADLKELFIEIQPYWIKVTSVKVEYIDSLAVPRE